MKSIYHKPSLVIMLFLFSVLCYAGDISVRNNPQEKAVIFGNGQVMLTLDYNGKCSISKLDIANKTVVSQTAGIFTEYRTSDSTFSSLSLLVSPQVSTTENTVIISGIKFGDAGSFITENWKFTVDETDIILEIERTVSKDMDVEEVSFPAFSFDRNDTWDGALAGNGGVAWFYLFNEKLCTYGVHTNYSAFWNSVNNISLKVTTTAEGRQIASRFSRSADDRLVYSVSVSDQEIVPRYDTDTKRRRFIRQKTDVWDAFTLRAGSYRQTVILSPADYSEEFGRGKFVGIDGEKITGLLNTVARIGVIDSKHYGANSWHTPYGPICLHEQYIAQLGVAINDPNYIDGYKECLNFYRDNAIKPDGRVFPRWAYDNSDMMKGEVNESGFYEAQWGYLLDSNTDLAINVSQLYNLCGDIEWVRTHKKSCEITLEYLLSRDSNRNNLVEMMTDSHSEKKGSDWIDIIWASFENAFVNAKLYYALTLWSGVEKQLGDTEKSAYYSEFARKLKESFNKTTDEGGFWDPKNKWYVHWRDSDNSIHGNNLVTPVNFMAIAYGICSDTVRRNAILNKVESQMQMENLFFWPICLYPYQTDEGLDYQFPFPYYENGDLFLSWGEVGVRCYAETDPDLALKYIENVLQKYNEDGLAFQRYSRISRQGAGDDILAGNSLPVVGLFTSIYGINPLPDRLYLNPHLPEKLSGTELLYNFRKERLKIGLATNKYSVSNNQFCLSSVRDFGFFADQNELSYFNGNGELYSLKAKTDKILALYISRWDSVEYSWLQSSESDGGMVTYTMRVSNANSTYTINYGKKAFKTRSDSKGIIEFKMKTVREAIHITIKPLTI